MNPYVLLGLVIGWVASLAGGFWFGTSYERGQQAKQEVLLDKAVEKFTAANQKFSDDLGLQISTEFAGIQITNKTTINEVRHEHEIQTRILDNPDCNIPVTTWRVLNNARGFRETGSGTGGDPGAVRTDGAPAVPAPGR